MAYHNEPFPLSIDRCGAAPVGNTTIIPVGMNGGEVRIVNWADGKIEFNVTPGIRTLTDLKAVVSFQRRRKYRAFSFPVRDLTDYTVETGAEGAFATGDSTAGPFQLTKTYSDDSNSDVRPITKPQADTVKIYVNGALKTEGVHYVIDYMTGKVTFTAGNYPASGAVLEWEGYFYVPVRFAEDKLPVQEFMMRMEWDAALEEMVVADGGGEISPILLVEDVRA